jgi:1-acyl-sn-glycerol-3-phosphate acyltransferase
MLPGLGAIAKKTRVPLVPTLIDGVYQAWPKGSLVPRFGDVIVHYGRPIMPDDYADMPADDLARLIRTRVLELQHDWHSRLPHRRLE